MHTYVYELTEISQDSPIKAISDIEFDSIINRLDKEFPNASFNIHGGRLLLEGHDNRIVDASM